MYPFSLKQYEQNTVEKRLFRKYFQMFSLKRFCVVNNLLEIADQFIGKFHSRSVFILGSRIILILEGNDRILAVAMEAAVFVSQPAPERRDHLVAGVHRIVEMAECTLGIVGLQRNAFSVLDHGAKCL